MPLDREKNSLLLDYYGVLLTRHQQDILDEYFNEDLSMNEIADNLQISKSAVQDLIKRSLTQLNEFEKKLKLIARDQKLNNILEEMKKYSLPEKYKSLFTRIEELMEDMSVEELQEVILEKMRRNGPVTDYMLGTVRENTHHGSLVSWARSFN